MDAFSDRPSFRLDDFTHQDVALYVQDKLSASPGYRELEALCSNEAKELIEQITTRAQGVFLWVRLVVHSLREGLSQGDRIRDLQARATALPADLESLYTKILDSVSPARYKDAAVIFEIVAAHLELESPIQFDTLFLAGAYDLGIDDKPLLRLDEAHRSMASSLFARRLNACTRGLLELSEPGPMAEYQVRLLHRTVSDFLSLPKVRAPFQNATGHDFNPRVRLAEGYIKQVETWVPTSTSPPISPCMDPHLELAIFRAIHFSIQTDPHRPDLQLSLLSRLDGAAQACVRYFDPKSQTKYWATYLREQNGLSMCESFLSLLIVCQLYSCVDLLLQKSSQTSLTQTDLDLLLEQSLVPMPRLSSSSRYSFCHTHPSKDTIYLLLRHGANPNAQARFMFNGTASTILERAFQMYYKDDPGLLELFHKHSSDFEGIVKNRPSVERMLSNPSTKDMEKIGKKRPSFKRVSVKPSLFGRIRSVCNRFD